MRVTTNEVDGRYRVEVDGRETVAYQALYQRDAYLIGLRGEVLPELPTWPDPIRLALTIAAHDLGLFDGGHKQYQSAMQRMVIEE